MERFKKSFIKKRVNHQILDKIKKSSGLIKEIIVKDLNAGF